MKVHFITSRETLINDREGLQVIIGAIKKAGHTLASDWIDQAYNRHMSQNGTSADWKKIFKANLENIAEADVIIAETTYENFGVGYQIASAVHQKKPVLLLRRDDADKNAFVTGVDDGWVRHVEYNRSNIDDLLGAFLDDNDISTKDMRFNFFIDRPIYNYLRWASLKTGKTKAEVLRELVQREINAKDV